jgi:hypothetical protein
VTNYLVPSEDLVLVSDWAATLEQKVDHGGRESLRRIVAVSVLNPALHVLRLLNWNLLLPPSRKRRIVKRGPRSLGRDATKPRPWEGWFCRREDDRTPDRKWARCARDVRRSGMSSVGNMTTAVLPASGFVISDAGGASRRASLPADVMKSPAAVRG